MQINRFAMCSRLENAYEYRLAICISEFYKSNEVSSKLTILYARIMSMKTIDERCWADTVNIYMRIEDK